MIGFIIALIWIIGGIAAYEFDIKKWEESTQFEKIWLSAVWPLLKNLSREIPYPLG